jgi:hypothetical protein
MEPVSLTIQAKAVPATHYKTLQELISASWPFELRWQLVPAV